MRKKVLTMLMAITILVAGICYERIDSKAESLGEDIDYSYLLSENALIGYTESQTWGVYLLNGTSVINKISSSQIGAGGVTNAAKSCTVSITSIVERQTSTGWSRVTSWTQKNENALSAMISKSLTVGTGYYYRVRSHHYASTDSSSSIAGSLWMGN